MLDHTITLYQSIIQLWTVLPPASLPWPAKMTREQMLPKPKMASGEGEIGCLEKYDSEL